MKFTHLASFFFSRKPSQVAFLLTLRCNSRCSWCHSWQEPKTKELNLKEIGSIFKQLKRFGIKLLYLSGGEPLFRKDILKIIKLASDFGFDLILVTNGTLLNPPIIHRLVKFHNLRLNVSLDSLDKNLYQKIRGIDALERVLKNLQFFRKAYPHYPLRITMTVSAANLEETDKVFQFCQKNRFYFSPNPYYPSGRFRKKSPLHDYQKINKQLIIYYQKMAQKVKTEPYLSGLPLVYRKLIDWLMGKMKEPCGAGEELLYLDPRGLVYACQDLAPFADLTTQDLGKEWSKKSWQPAVKKCSQETPCFIFCSRSPYIIKHHKIKITYDLLTSPKLLHYFKMY